MSWALNSHNILTPIALIGDVDYNRYSVFNP